MKRLGNLYFTKRGIYLNRQRWFIEWWWLGFAACLPGLNMSIYIHGYDVKGYLRFR